MPHNAQSKTMLLTVAVRRLGGPGIHCANRREVRSGEVFFGPVIDAVRCQFVKSMRILMVDDEPLICESMRMMLELDGHEMDEAYSGWEALQKLDHLKFDLIFTDFCMPDMKGDQLARAVRGRNAQPPVVMITGFPPNPAPVEVARVMIKPFDLRSIRGVIRDLNKCSVRGTCPLEA